MGSVAGGMPRPAGAGVESNPPAMAEDSLDAIVASLGRPKHRSWIAFSGALSLLLIIFAIAISILEWRKQLAATDSELQSAAEMGSRAVDSYFDSLQLSLEVLRDSLPDMRDEPAAIEVRMVALRALKTFHASHPELRNVIIAGADGRFWVASNRPADAPMPSLEQDDSFRVYSRDAPAGFEIGRPTRAQMTSEWIIPARLPVRDGASHLRYFVGASLPADFIASFWRNASIVSKASLGIMRDDGYLLSRYPNEPTVRQAHLYGTPRTGSLMDYLRANRFPEGGFLAGIASADGFESRFAFRRLTRFPVTLFVEQPTARIWAAWWENARVSLLLILILLVGGIAASLVFARAQLAHSRTLYRALALSRETARQRDIAIDSMSQGLCMFDAQQRLLVCNRQYADLYHLSPEQTKPGTTMRQILEHRIASGNTPGDHASYLADRIAEVTRNNPYRITNQLKDGRHISVVHQPTSDGGWVATHEDVTPQHKAADELHSVKSFLDTIIQSIPVSIVIKDAETRRMILINKAYESFYGARREEVLGRTLFDLYPEEKARYLTKLDTDSINSADAVVVSELPMDTKGRGSCIVQMTKIVVRDREQRPQYVISLIEDITDRKNSESKIEHLAHYDALTNLANRNLFRERIDETLARMHRSGEGFAVFLLDLDRFKAVNDTSGHQTGDELLRQVAGRIKSIVRDTDTAARLGGDEFALIIMVDRHSWSASVAALAKRLVEGISAPYEINGHPVVVGCSIGVALAPDHGQRSDDLLKNADLALYKSKHSGRNCFHVYADAFKTEADQRNALENDLREAIWLREIQVFYQPIVDLANGRIVSVEALARWRHPVRGDVPPAQFIAVAEDAGLIVQLGEHVLAQACTDATRMPDDVKVSINLSPVQFAKSNVVDSAIFALANSMLAPERLVIEITEGVLLAETEQNLETLRQLKNVGVSIALDDFGVGYSSLGYLTSFRFDEVKIDKSFVKKLDRIESRAVISSIVQLSRSLNLTTVVEGIETAEQLATVAPLGIALAQGYLFGTPVPFTELDFKTRLLPGASEAA
jgi:diguanylate cyclase (GGDEF)-like protein/PAS domain S-box-containing protein